MPSPLFRRRFLVLLLVVASCPLSLTAAVQLRSRTIDAGATASTTLAIADEPTILLVHDAVTASVRRDLTDLGVLVDGYIPEDALLVRIPAAELTTVLERPYVAAILPLVPDDKLSPLIDMPAWPDEPDLVGVLTVQLFPGSDVSAVAPLVEAASGGTILQLRAKGRYPRLTVRVTAGDERRAALDVAVLPDVLWIEPAGLARWTNDTSIWVGQSWIDSVTPMFAAGLFGSGQIVGISDTGLDADHGSFFDLARGLPGPTVDPLQRKVIAYHDRLQDGNWDAHGHGTHVAGTIAGDLDGDGQWDANGNNQAPDGMAPAAQLSISDADDTCLPGNPIDLVELFQETYDDGARLHSNSWTSCSCNEYTVHAQDVDEFMWATRDMLVLFAAANSGPGANTVQPPATAKGCVTVGASRRADEADTLAGFSSRGPAADGRLEPTVTAPGVGIRSAAGDGNINSFNDGVVAFSGTSMATPTTTGLATLIREYLVRGFYPSGTARPADAMAPSAALLKAMLVNSGRNMLNETTAPSHHQGWGRVLLDDVLYLAGDARQLWLVDEQRGLSSPGERRTFPLLVGAGVGDLKVTLTWTDPPSATLVGVNLVNDLDLTVSGPGGVFRGNVFVNGDSQQGGAADRLNVVEGVRIVAPTPGTWLVTIEAANIPFGPQPYAVVATGDVQPAPHVGHRGHIVADPQGDGDTTAEPGELVELTITIGEDAGTAATSIDVTLTPLEPWATIVSPTTQTLPDLAGNATASSPTPWLLVLAPDAPCGAPLPFRVVITTDQGTYDDGFVLTTGGDVRTTTVVLADAFDTLGTGAPPDLLLWSSGFVTPPGPGVALRVAADPTVQPAGTPIASPPNALYVGRAGGGNAATETWLATQPLDLSTFDSASLTFAYWVRELEGGIANRDVFSVDASEDGGATFPHLLYQNPDYASGMDSSLYPDGRWHTVSLDLGRVDLLQTDVVVRFRVLVNADEPLDAVYLDDIRVEADTITCSPGCIAPLWTTSPPLPLCVGDATTLSPIMVAQGFGSFDGAWDFGDASGQPVSPLDQAVNHAWSSGGNYTPSLTATATLDPTCARVASVAVDVDEPPTLDVVTSAPVCVDDPAVTLSAAVIAPGFGVMTHSWDFGDGSPPLVVADPTVPISHVFPAVAGSYFVTLTSDSARVTGCEAVASTPVVVGDIPTADAGPSPVDGPVVLGAAACDPSLIYGWDPPLGLSDPTTCAPLAAPNDDTTYCVVATDPVSGCASAPACVDVRTCTPPPSRITTLLGIALPPSDVGFDWDDESQSRGGYHGYRVTAKGDIPMATAVGLRVIDTALGATNSASVIAGDLPGSGGTVFFYQVVGVCTNGTEGAQ